MVQTRVANSSKASALFASRQFLAGRLALSVMIAYAAYALGQRGWPPVWLAMMAASVCAQLYLGRLKTRAASEADDLILWARTGLSLFDTTLYAAASAAISQADTALAGGFATLIVMLTMLYVLMHFYMDRGLVMAFSAPCVLSLLYCLGGHEIRQALGSGIWPSLVPLLGVGFALHFFASARSHLARARRALVATRSEAVQRATEAQAASQAKTEFLATMGHEIRTPLNGVLGIAQAMSGGSLSTEQQAQLKVIQDSGETLLVILNDLLDISKIEAGRLELEVSSFSMGTLVREVRSMFAAAANAKGVDLTVALAPGAEGVFEADQARLRQILYNLVSNAVKFTPAGAVSVAVSHADGRLRLAVRDTGVGVPAERQGELFQTFVQADGSATRRYGGAGLGLAIVDRLVTRMGGSLAFTSAEGVGSTFTVTLPMTRTGDDTGDPTDTPDDRGDDPGGGDAPEAAAAGGGEGLRILVAEDNATNQLVVRLMLAQAGVEPRLVENGRDAVAAWQASDWDLILMDIQMPEMDGVSATRCIRRLELETGRTRTPIVALTANAMTHQKAEYLAAGIDDLVSKPINAADLIETLERALDDDAPASAAA